MLQNFDFKSRQNLIFLFILCFGFLIRTYHLAHFAPFTDEKFTYLCSQGISVGGANQGEVFFEKKYFVSNEFWKTKNLNDYYEAIARCDFGTHFSYVILLKYWISIVGFDDFSIRFLSVIFSILGIWLIYLLAKNETKSNNIALIVAFLVAIEPLFIAQSRMARSYSVGIFFSVLSSYYFLKIIFESQTKTKHFIIYALSCVICLLTHYITVWLMVAQSIFALIYLRNSKKWLHLSIVALLNGAVLYYWLFYGGGKWSFEFLADKNELHKKLANLPPDQNPLRGVVEIPTLKNLLLKTSEIISDIFILTNGVLVKMIGLKNMIVSLVTGLGIFGLYISQFKYKIHLIFVLQIITILIYSINKEAFFVFQNVVFLTLLGIRNLLNSNHKRIIIYLLLTLLVPLSYLLFDAVKGGHTGNLAQRYLFISYPYCMILVAILINEATKIEDVALKYLMIFVLVLQCFYVLKTDWKILTDTEPKYSYFAKPREQNPHRKVAKIIKKQYAEGDTLVLPSWNNGVYDKIRKAQSYDIMDAQLINLYFDKDSKIIERVNPNEADKVYLNHKNGEKTLIFDFGGVRY
jgi:hypothetical protein